MNPQSDQSAPSQFQPALPFPGYVPPPGPANHWTSNMEVPKLDKTNFLPWKRSVSILLKHRGLIAAVESEDAPESINELACMTLLNAMDIDHRMQVVSLTNAKAIMRAMERKYANQSESNKHRLVSSFVLAKQAAGDDLSQHVGKLNVLRAALANLGEEPSESFFQVILINSLAPEFGNVMGKWSLMHPTMKTTECLLEYLTEKEKEVMKAPREQTVMIVKGGHDKAWSEMTIAERKKISRCKKCNEKGHWAKECQNPKAIVTPAPNQTSHVAMVIFNAGYIGPGLKGKWLADSGASKHMSNQRSWFSEIEMFERPIMASVGDGNKVEILGQGTVPVIAVVGDHRYSVALKNVAYIPSLAANLLSIGAVADQGFEATFKEGVCSIKKGEEIFARGIKTDKLYIMDFAEQNASAFLTKTRRTMDEWHEVMGHAGVDRVERASKQHPDEIEIERVGQRCGFCAQGKARHVSHPSKDVSDRAETVGVRVHVDLVHVGNKDERLYFLLCKDEFSEFCLVYVMESKDCVPDKINTLILDFEMGSGSQIKSIHSDNGSEFVNCKVDLLLRRTGILHRTSSPYCPEQNGIVERAVQTIVNAARTMLIASGLPNSLKREAIKTACYVNNRLPTSRSNTTPFERFTGRKPYYAHMFKFGEPVQIIDGTIRHPGKFDIRTIPGFVVGYTNRRNTYRVYVSSKDRVVETCEVIFAPHSKPVTAESSQHQAEFYRGTINNPESASNMRNNEKSEGKKEWECESSEQSGEERGEPQEELKESEHNSNCMTGQRLQDYFDDLLTRNQSAAGTAPSAPHEAAGVERQEAGEDDVPSPKEFSFSRSEIPYWPNPPNLATQPSTPTEGERLKSPPSLWSKQLNSDGRDDEGEKSGAPVDQKENPSDVREGEPNPFEGRGLARSPIRKSQRLMDKLSARMPQLFLMAEAEDVDIDEPQSYGAATIGPNNREWRAAISEELSAHRDNETWTIVNRSDQTSTLTTKWVFKVKRGKMGEIERFKARLVARGFQQREGLDYFETYAPVANISTVRALIAIAAVRKLAIKQFDVSTAFLNGKLEESVYVEPPEGLALPQNKCLKLNKALYGLKQAPRAWNSCFHETLTVLGFEQASADSCLYIDQAREIFIVVYVDDGLIISHTEREGAEVISKLNSYFKTKEITGSVFLGLEIERNEEQTTIKQTRYINDVLKRFNLADCQPVSAPVADIKSLFDEDQSADADVPYMSAIGSLLYCALCTRPDILFGTIALSCFNQHPKDKHWVAVKRIMRYLKGTADHALVYPSREVPESITISGFSDADYANDREWRRSTTGIVVHLSNCPVLFKSKKQTPIAQSSCEAEFVAANEATKDLIWLTRLLDDLRIKHTTPKLYIDNAPALRLIKTGNLNQALKHIDVKYKYIVDQERQGNIIAMHIPGKDQPADLLTKALNGPTTSRLSRSVGLTPRVLGALAFLLLISGTFSIELKTNFVKAPWVMWSETNDKVNIGTIQIKATFIGDNLCDRVKAARDKYGIESTPHKAFDRLLGHCLQSHRENFKPAEDRLIQAIERKPRARHLTKRCVEPVSFGLCATATVYLIGGLIGAGLYMWHPDSPRNVVPTLQAQIQELRGNLTNIYNITQLENAIAKDYYMSIANLTHKYEELRVSGHENAMNSADMSWLSSEIFTTMYDNAHALVNIANGYLKGKVPLKDMAKILKVPQLGEYEVDDTKFLNIELNKNVTGVTAFMFTFSIRMVSREALVYVADPFDIYVNYTDHPTLITYAGKTHMIHNSTNNCTNGIAAPRPGIAIYERCDIENFADPNLQLWVRHPDVNTSFNETNVRPIVKKLADKAFVYCLFQNITLGETVLRCPPYPFVIDAHYPFQVLGHEHKVEIKDYHNMDRGTFLPYKSLNDSLSADIFLQDNLQLLESSRKKTMEIDKILGQRANSLHIPLEGPTPWLIGVVGALTWFLTVILCVACLRRQTPFGGEPSRSATSNVQYCAVIVPNQRTKEGPEETILAYPELPSLPPRNDETKVIEGVC